jgi:hypothetical protein
MNYSAKDAQGPRLLMVGASFLLTDELKLSGGYYYATRATGFSNWKAVNHMYNAALTYELRQGLMTYVAFNLSQNKNPAAAYESTLLATRLKDVSNAGSLVNNPRSYAFIVGVKASF